MGCKHEEVKMDMISEAVDYLLKMHSLNYWAEAVTFINEVSYKPTSHWLLPEAACLAVGGTHEQAVPAVAAMLALHTSIVMVDDLLDNDGRFEPIGLTKGDVANLSLVLSSAGLDAICRGDADVETQQKILTHLNHMMVTTAQGQYWDAHMTISAEGDYWRITRQKSAPFFGAAFYTGAVMGKAQPETAQDLLKLGNLLGEMIQIHDDLKDTLSTRLSSDWNERRCSLPILYAHTVNHPDRDRFISLHGQITEPNVLVEAQRILFRCGAVSYCNYQILERYKSAQVLLEKSNVIDSKPIVEVFQKVIDPVLHLNDQVQDS
jgi:geranylgeranyl pyrophosphate synthase